MAAEQAMEEIGLWTASRFGPDQAERHLDDLISRCDAVAAAHLPHRACRQHFARDLRADLRFIRAGQHFVFFVEFAEDLRIIAIIHQSADISSRLMDLP